jgi:hypothetical protein
MPKLKYIERKDPWTWAERNAWTPYEAETRRAWLVHRSQARYRHEEHLVTLEEYRSIWGDNFTRRGRSPEDLTMTRIDDEKGWTVDNIKIISREEHCREQINRRHQEGTMRGPK